MATEKVIGVDIGNSSTEVALADVADNQGYKTKSGWN